MAESYTNGQKTLWERRNCLLQAISPFPTVFSKDLYCRQIKQGLILEMVNFRRKVISLSDGVGKKSGCMFCAD